MFASMYNMPGIGRFASADSIVPNPTNPQDYNRYSYTLNNPIRFTDPTGHWTDPNGASSGGGGTPICADTGIMSICNGGGIGLAHAVASSADEDTLPELVEEVTIASAAYVIYMAKDYTERVAELGNASLSGELRDGMMVDPWGTITYYGPTVLETVGLGMTIVGPRVPHAPSAPNAPCNSFSADTLVSTEDGLVPISDLEVGDYVLAYDEETGETDYYAITHTWEHLDPSIAFVTIDGETIETTPWHLFYTEYGWQEAEDLWPGARILDARGQFGSVQILVVKEQQQMMYDLTVEDVHNFFVGSQQWLVHNCGDGTFYHYTDAAGAESIDSSGVIKPNSRGQVYVTSQQVPANDANSVLFAGNPNYGSRGSHVVEFKIVDDLPLHPGTQPNELIHYGSLRNGGNVNIISVGENRFGIK